MLSAKAKSPPKEVPVTNGEGNMNGNSLRAPSPPDGRPMSPMRISRIDEKNALASLNNRLAAIIDRNTHLEKENANLGQELQKAESNYSVTMEVVKTTYDKDMGELRKKLEDTEKDKVKLGLSEAQLRKDLKDANDKIQNKDKEAAALQQKLSFSEGQVTKLQADNKAAADEKAKLAKEKQDALDNAAKLAKELAELKKKLEADAMAKVELENALRVKSDELQTKSQIHEQQFAVLRSKSKQEIQEVDGRLQKEYQEKLADAIKELRAECAAQINMNKHEQEILYNKKEADAKAEVDRAKDALNAKANELKTITTDMDGIKKKLATLEGEKKTLEQNLGDLASKGQKEKDAALQEKNKMQEVLTQMMKERKVLIQEYHDLMDEKVALDNEIATYRKLLEGEEERLSMTTKPAKKGQFLQSLIGTKL
jgi:hypothetical protein